MIPKELPSLTYKISNTLDYKDKNNILFGIKQNTIVLLAYIMIYNIEE